ncbi:hypothetical protein [Pilosibacter fragilis]
MEIIIKKKTCRPSESLSILALATRGSSVFTGMEKFLEHEFH